MTAAGAAPVRPMAADDLPAVRELAAQLGYPASAPEISDRFEALAHSPLHALLVAAAPGESPSGFLHVSASTALLHAPEAEIVALVVEGRARGRGVGASLVASAEAWARSRGLGSLRVRCRVEREPAHRFYQRLGFERTKTQHVFTKALVAALPRAGGRSEKN
ncbi:MAG: GNAT family N-acetyltransferase [Acidobacteriota bacterium]|nr:GNAT family N-acetyltransferase [Acidobacteriota bacterium]